MLCHPKEIQKLPEYANFKEDYKKYRELESSRNDQYRARQNLIKKYAKYGIFLTPKECSEKCPYYKICKKHDNLWGDY